MEFGVHHRKEREKSIQNKKNDMFVFELFEINPVLLIDFLAKLAIFHHFLQIFFVFYFTAFSDRYPDLVPG